MDSAWTPNRTVQQTITEPQGPSLEYLAGFFDGEGCFSCDVPTDNECIQFVAQVQTTCEREVCSFREEFGGSVWEATPEKEHHSTSYLWRVRGKDAKRMAEVLLPHLNGKAEQASVLIDAVRHKHQTKSGARDCWTEREIKTMHEYGEQLRSLSSAQRRFAEGD
jgi:hypothetical protein